MHPVTSLNLEYAYYCNQMPNSVADRPEMLHFMHWLCLKASSVLLTGEEVSSCACAGGWKDLCL
jgi:hypothetical protein